MHMIQNRRQFTRSSLSQFQVAYKKATV